MIDPATGWFEIAEIPNKRADYMANILEFNWLSRYPWPTEIRMDRGNEFAAEVSAALKNEYGIKKKLITTRNPQANSIIERIHQVVGDMIRTRDIRGKDDIDPDFGWSGVLSAVRSAVATLIGTHHHTHYPNTASVWTPRSPQHLLRGRLGVHQGTKATLYPPKQQEGKCQTHSPHLQRRRPSDGQRKSTPQARRS